MFLLLALFDDQISTAMKWFTLCIISGTMVGGFSTKDQNSLDERIPIRKAWITREGCVSGIAHVLVANLLTNRVGNLKLVGIGLSCISGAKGDLCLEFSPASSFDLVTSFCTSSSRLFMHRSCTRNELVEFDDKVSGSHGVCSSPRCGAVDFSGTIEGVSDRVSGGFCFVGPGRVGVECS
ncbi:hypothetical protein BHE74_00036320 [Ensete ventricosum]|nr:hypothetical protein BHE74_00036320 [Ensete ventricosum]